MHISTSSVDELRNICLHKNVINQACASISTTSSLDIIVDLTEI